MYALLKNYWLEWQARIRYWLAAPWSQHGISYGAMIYRCFAKSFHFCLRLKGFVNKISQLFYTNK